MKRFVLRLFLLRGPAWQRLFLFAFYGIAVSSVIALLFVCSFPPPDDYPTFSDRMDRAMMGPALFLLPLDALSVICWLLGLVFVCVRAFVGRFREGWGLGFALLAPVWFLLFSRIYAGIFTGRLRGLHEFLYAIHSS